MKCPHCLKHFHEQFQVSPLPQDISGTWNTKTAICPACKKNIIFLLSHYKMKNGFEHFPGFGELLVYPKNISRTPLSPFVSEEFTAEYKEACDVLSSSPKASAALSRRILQLLLRKKASVKESTLSSEIDEVLDSKILPSYLAESLDAIRVIGNFAAHPTKSKNTGEIVTVEPGEAEWLLDVLESLFDFFFVQPEILNDKKNQLNEKLKEIGKPQLK